MTLPKRPERSTPIPNQPFDSPEVTTIKGPYWDMPLGSGLEADPYGSVQTSGSEPSEPSAFLYGSNGFVGVGTGLTIEDGQLSNSCDRPPFNCRTDLNTFCVTDFSNAWLSCQSLTIFPKLDTSHGTNFDGAWAYCYNLESFPEDLDLSSGTRFMNAWNSCESLTSFPSTLHFNQGEVLLGSAWKGCSGLTSFPSLSVSFGYNVNFTWGFCSGLTSFPILDLSKGTAFWGTWSGCTSLISFPEIYFNTEASFGAFYPYYGAWANCTSLRDFPPHLFDNCQGNQFLYAWYNCALSQQSVDNILVSLNTAGKSSGVVHINGGTSSAPGPSGLAAKASLQAKGWTVLTN